MPSCQRYVLRRDFPRLLEYRGAALGLEIVRRSLGGDNEWVLRARKIVPASACDIVTSRFGKFGFESMMFGEGFVLEDGTPAARIMQRLVREGHAISHPERSRA